MEPENCQETYVFMQKRTMFGGGFINHCFKCELSSKYNIENKKE